MTLLEAIQNRHSIRRYKKMPLADDVVSKIQQKVDELNILGNLNMQLVTNEPKGFGGIFSYGVFSGVTNYFVVAGKKSEDLEERAGYYGEQLVLYAQQLGLNTCWVGFSYQKVAGTYTLEDDEKIVCYIALGYGDEQGRALKRKSVQELSNVSPATPQWFFQGVEAARLAPTAVNQQKFHFEYIEGSNGAKHRVRAQKKFSLFGYTQIDLGIVKLHFEIGAGKSNFDWE